MFYELNSITHDIPVILGSGINIENIGEYFAHADAFIIGTHFKKDSDWTKKVDREKVMLFMGKYNGMREK